MVLTLIQQGTTSGEASLVWEDDIYSQASYQDEPNKHETLSQCCFIVVPASKTVGQQ